MFGGCLGDEKTYKKQIKKHLKNIKTYKKGAPSLLSAVAGPLVFQKKRDALWDAVWDMLYYIIYKHFVFFKNILSF